MTAMPGSVQAMLGAMVVLALPAFLVCLGVAIMAYRRRDRSPGS
jgi:hypothetical protein